MKLASAIATPKNKAGNPTIMTPIAKAIPCVNATKKTLPTSVRESPEN